MHEWSFATAAFKFYYHREPSDVLYGQYLMYGKTWNFAYPANIV